MADEKSIFSDDKVVKLLEEILRTVREFSTRLDNLTLTGTFHPVDTTGSNAGDVE